MVRGVERMSGGVAALQRSAEFEALLRAVVTRFAEALQIEGGEEQRLVALVRDDVIDHGRGRSDFELKAVDAKRLRGKLIPAKPSPFFRAVETQRDSFGY